MNADQLQEIDVLAKIVVAALAAVIAWRQVSIAHAKLKFDLFERREKIYLAAQHFANHVAGRQIVDEPELQTFREAIQPARWLFDERVWEYLLLMHGKAIEFQHCIYVRSLPRTSEASKIEQDRRDKIANDFYPLASWWLNQLEDLPAQFAEHLRIQSGVIHSLQLRLAATQRARATNVKANRISEWGRPRSTLVHRLKHWIRKE